MSTHKMAKLINQIKYILSCHVNIITDVDYSQIQHWPQSLGPNPTLSYYNIIQHMVHLKVNPFTFSQINVFRFAPNFPFK